MNDLIVRIIGYLLMAIGLLTALAFGGNRGFTAGATSGAAYIGGFLIAFLGAYLAFLWGRKRARDSEL